MRWLAVLLICCSVEALAECERVYVCHNHHVACNCPATPPCLPGSIFPGPIPKGFKFEPEGLYIRIHYHGQLVEPMSVPKGACGVIRPPLKKYFLPAEVFYPSSFGETLGVPFDTPTGKQADDDEGPGYDPEAALAKKPAAKTSKSKPKHESTAFEAPAQTAGVVSSEAVVPPSAPAEPSSSASEAVPATPGGAAEVGFGSPPAAPRTKERTLPTLIQSPVR